METCTVGTTGFVNYFCSSERTERKTKEALEKFGFEIAIINGEDDWNCSSAFHIGYLLERFGIVELEKFHDGISGITSSGAVIKKSDLPIFITKYNKIKYDLMRNDRRKPWGRCDGEIKIFDCENDWRTFFKAKIGKNGLFRDVVNFKRLKKN